MSIYVSRYANPTLKSGDYVCVRISIGSPRWDLGYKLAGEIKELMPYGAYGLEVKEEAEKVYRKRLEGYGVYKIRRILEELQARFNKDIVLLCYEDIRKEDNWCHRTMFSQWWYENTKELIAELPDPTPPPAPKPVKAANNHPTASVKTEPPKPTNEQLSMFPGPLWGYR
jgi:hypothetical protein